MDIDLEKKNMIKYFSANNLSLNKLMNNIFNKKIKKMTYLGNNILNKMPEYKFSLLKFNIVLEDYRNYYVFIRLINRYQIKESLFCYWFFCDEYFCLNTKFSKSKANIINYNAKFYERRYELNLFGKNNKISKNSLIDVINLKQYSKVNIKNISKETLEHMDKFLFIAIW